MIFAAVGTQKFQFNRLLRTIDELVYLGRIKETVYVQKGYSDYVPEHYQYSEFLNQKDFLHYIECCDLLITHSGVATIISGIQQNKPVIIMPRLARYGEHVDDHQVEIAKSFSEQNYVLLCQENDSLADLIEKAKTHKFSKYISKRQHVIKLVEDYLESIDIG